jgi:hypothetical protein
MINLDGIKHKNFGEWGKIDNLTLKVVDVEGGIVLEVAGDYNGSKITSSLHPWTLAMVNECYGKFDRYMYLRTLCGRALERKIKIMI